VTIENAENEAPAENKNDAHRDEPPPTASGGNLGEGEVIRNERSPLRGVAKIENADRRKRI